MTDSESDMLCVMQRCPDLTDFGLGVSRQQIFNVERAKLLEDRSLAQFTRARGWLRKFSKTKAHNGRGDSYGLKHVAEIDIGYVTNGVFIAAALAEGFSVKRNYSGSPNARFNISSKALSRPDVFAAERAAA
jgi:hypothetical protein